MPLFSVIIPVFNRPTLVKAAIESVFAQTCSDYELIVVDDGSTDDTPTVLASLGERVQVVRQANAGPGAARNTGAEHATGRYLAFLDSDDLWFTWTLATYEAVLREHGDLAFIVGTFVMLRDDQPPTATNDPLHVERYADYLASTASPTFWYGGTCGVCVRRDVFRESGGFIGDRVNAEDLDLWLRLGTAPGFAQIVRPVLFAYRQHTSNAVVNLARSLRGVLRLIGQEREGRFPGGRDRRQERLRILTIAVRQVSLECLRAGRARDAWDLYRRSFAWHLRLARLQYLLGFPILAMAHALKPAASMRPGSAGSLNGP